MGAKWFKVRFPENFWIDNNKKVKMEIFFVRSFEIDSFDSRFSGYNACFKLNQDHIALQFKDKCGAFYKSISIIEFLEECFGGGNRGGDKGRGGRGGARGGYGGGRNSVTEQHFWMDKGNRAKAEKLLKGLQVNTPEG